MSALNQGLTELTGQLGVPQDVSDLITRELGALEQAGTAPGLSVGDEAPDFELPDARSACPTCCGTARSSCPSTAASGAPTAT
jgi:hypothetical protein